ncbi:MAG: CDP-alcohol phosphatidyltransferase family protein [Gammaproteobacteria bacterium]|jgi:CDP-diacylglycerol--glycerol-3-phosphate 3-phosphatidyltransferase|nr:CDP-alcohol phosphatidyltransferase family protein [Gammaproteobacteria bacterium]
MTIYDLKPAFQNLLRPACGVLARAGITANQVTLAAMFLSIATGAALIVSGADRWALFLVPAVLFLRMALNAIDGMLAREHGMQSALGGLLNELGDVVSDVALYLPFGLVAGISPVTVVATVVLAALSEMTGVVAVQIGASRRYDGPMGKSDRAAAFGLLAVLLACGLEPGAWATAGLLVIAALTAATILRRARGALDELDQPG